jgi:hypothetical protein
MGACARRGGDDARHSQGLTKVPRHIPRLAFLGLVFGGDVVLRILPVRQCPTRRDQPAAYVDPIGREDLRDQATMPVPLDHLAAHVDPAIRASRAANDIVPRAICWPRHQNV